MYATSTKLSMNWSIKNNVGMQEGDEILGGGVRLAKINTTFIYLPC